MTLGKRSEKEVGNLLSTARWPRLDPMHQRASNGSRLSARSSEHEESKYCVSAA
jgi:hypothetical protein